VCAKSGETRFEAISAAQEAALNKTNSLREICESATIQMIHLTVLGVCFLTNVIDGLDTQIIGITASPIAKDLGVSLPMFSLVFTASTMGVLLGAMLLGRLADRIGRRPSLVIFTILFGVLTLVTPLVRSATELAALRFASGLGLGGAMPVFLTLVAEYAPKSRRALATGLLWCGYPIGGVVGGVLGSVLIDSRGWQVMYIIGGCLALGVAALQWALLPESPFYLVLRPDRQDRVRKLVRRIAPGFPVSDADYVAGDERELRQARTTAKVAEIFTDGRTATTALLWLSLFCTFTITKFTVLWAPSLFEAAGMSAGKAALMQAIGNMAGVPSMVLAGFFLDRIGAGRVLPVTYGLLSLAMVTLAFFLKDGTVVAVSMVAIGLLGSPGVAGLLFLATTIYPSQLRSTGVGFAMGVGRTGQIFVALFVGGILALGLGPSGVVLTMAAVPLTALVAVILLTVRLKARGQDLGTSGRASAVTG
jgi:MFS transporter, AAHS family, 4-hydroxybenzoate transporter